MVQKIYLCPCDKKYSCSWEGFSDDILQHFSEEHEELLSFSNSVSVDLRETSENKLILYDEEIYLLQFKIIEEHLYVFLRYLGPSKIAAQITFDINIQSNDVKLDKQFITVRCGYFGISLDKIKETFEGENVLECILFVSGDFKSVLSIEEIQEEQEVRNESTEQHKKEVVNENDIQNDIDINHNEKLTIPTIEYGIENSIKDDDDVFDKSPDSGISVGDDFKNQSPRRYDRHISFTIDNSTFYNQVDGSVKDSSVTRSQSLNDECRRKTVLKKHPSVHSLESISEDDLDSELHCVNCENLLFSPIFSCLNGHNVCSHCAVRVELCKLCNEKIHGQRNMVLEDKALNHLFSCKYKKNGCSTKLPYRDILKHAINCTCCMYVCPITGCGHVGAFKNMHQHLKLIHSSTKLFESLIATFQKQNDAFLVHAEKGIFYCCVLNHGESVVWEAKFCGPKERKFFCELKFKERNLKEPLLLRQSSSGDCYKIELNSQELKKLKVKSKNAILTITR